MTGEFRLPERLASLAPSQIRENMRIAQEVGAINLAQGRPDFPADPAVKEAAIEAIRRDENQYSVTWGVPELRRAVARMLVERYGMVADPDTEITITCGVTEGMMAAVLATVEKDEEVVIIEPAHENYVPAVRFAGAVPRFVFLRPPEFRFDPEELESVMGGRARMLIVNTPHNPSGRVFSREELEAMARVCAKRDAVLLTDEIYDRLVYDGGSHVAPGTLEAGRGRTITAGGISKIFAVTGWRLGYVVAPPPVTAAIRTIHDYLTICAPTPLQHGAIAALALPASFHEKLLADYTKRRDRCVAGLREAGFSVGVPEGAYYVLADFTRWGFKGTAREFTRALITRARVATVEGPVFYSGRPELGERLVRFAYAKDVATLDEAARRLKECFQDPGKFPRA